MFKFAVIGGAFDPFHFGHLAMGRYIQRLANRVWFMPCKYSLYGKSMTDPQHRINMIKLGIDNEPGMEVSELEINGGLSGITIETVQRLKESFTNFAWVIGQDNAESIYKWVRYDELINLVPFIVLPREGCKKNFDWYEKEPHIWVKDAMLPAISSTKIRNESCNLHTDSPPKVTEYILKEKLYWNYE